MSRILDRAKQELIRPIYVPMKFFRWSVPVEFIRNETEVIKMEMGVKLGQGFMPVFLSREEALKYHPDCKIIEIMMLNISNNN